jgi:SPX domain protein involved in polyphosphate accumulation
MEIYMEEPQINYRYERKFLVPEIHYNEILSSLYNMNYFVKHESRLINNIYFDNYNFSSLTENIEGLSQRKKYRIRWYGETFNNSNKSIEIKIKNEFVNSKKSYTFQNLKLNSLDNI